MDNYIPKICCACLCEEQKLLDLKHSHLLDVFLNIIYLNPLESSVDVKYMICWRCHALLRKYNTFLKLTNQSFSLLCQYTKEKLNIHDIKKKPSIAQYDQYNINIVNHKNLETGTKSQTEIKVEDTIEEEDSSLFKAEEVEDHYSDDNFSKLTDLQVDGSKDESCSPKKEKNTIDKKVSKKKKKKEALWLAVNLNDEELKEERRKMSFKELFLDAIFKCEGCLEIFANCEDYKQHVADKHDESKPHKCKICSRTFQKDVSLNNHTKKHKRRYLCCLCDKLLLSPSQVLRHRQCEHYGHNDKVQTQNSTPNPTDAPLQCDVCNKTFVWKTSLRKHMEKHSIETGQKRKPYCETCRMSFTSTANLQKHVKTSSKHEIQLKLRKINDPANSKFAAIEDIKKSVNSIRATFPCLHCDKQFQWRGNLLRHMDSHKAKAQGDLNCIPCNRTFSSIATYQQHMKLSKKHVTEKEFKYACEECGKRFANRTKLRDHVNWDHLKNYAHKCATCDKIFKSHTSLYIHSQVVHKKYGREHLCDHCGRAFPNSGKLRAHVNALHSKQCRYTCPVCDATFNWHSCLSRHKRVVHNKIASDKTAAQLD